MASSSSRGASSPLPLFFACVVVSVVVADLDTVEEEEEEEVEEEEEEEEAGCDLAGGANGGYSFVFLKAKQQNNREAVSREGSLCGKSGLKCFNTDGLGPLAPGSCRQSDKVPSPSAV